MEVFHRGVNPGILKGPNQGIWGMSKYEISV